MNHTLYTFNRNYCKTRKVKSQVLKYFFINNLISFKERRLLLFYNRLQLTLNLFLQRMQLNIYSVERETNDSRKSFIFVTFIAQAFKFF